MKEKFLYLLLAVTSLSFFVTSSVRAQEETTATSETTGIAENSASSEVRFNDEVLNITGSESVSADYDGDTVTDSLDNCPKLYNVDQFDNDKDGFGDLCDETPKSDIDSDGIPDDADNCIDVSNPTQSDSNNDGQGDACTRVAADYDLDGVADIVDNCPYMKNADQLDTDGDFMGDACDKMEQGGLLSMVGTPEFTVDTEKNKLQIVWQTNVPTTGAISYGYKEGDMEFYASDMESKLNHKIIIASYVKSEKNFFYRIVMASGKEKIESDVFESSLTPGNKLLNKIIPPGAVKAEKARNDLTDYEKGLITALNKESEKLQGTLFSTIFEAITILLAMMVVVKWNELPHLYSAFKTRLTRKRLL